MYTYEYVSMHVKYMCLSICMSVSVYVSMCIAFYIEFPARILP